MAQISKHRQIPTGDFYLPNKMFHIAIFGETGGGKSCTLKAVGECRRDNGWKILDLYDGASEENCYWALKSNHEFWGESGKRGKKPVAYKTRILVPLLLNKLPKKLPKICKLFRIRITSLSSDDIKAILGKQISMTLNVLWGVVKRKIKPSTTGEELLELIKEAASGKKGSGEVSAGKQGLRVLYNTIYPMVEQGLLCNDYDPMAIDILAEVKDKETITSLMLKFVPPQMENLNLRSFLVQYIARRIFEIKQSSEGHLRKIKTCILIREAIDFLSKGGVGDMGDSDMAVRDIIAKTLKQGRKFNLTMVIDAQSPSLLHASIKGQFKIILAHRVGDYSDLDEVISPSVKDQVTLGVKIAIGEMPQQCIVVLKPRERLVDGQLVGRGAFMCKMYPPKSRIMEEGEDFLEIYGKEFPDGFFTTLEVVSRLREEKRLQLEAIKNKEELKKARVVYAKSEERLKKKDPVEFEKKKALTKEELRRIAMES